MTATATLAPGGVVWAKATRITALDNEGNIIPGSSVFVTDAVTNTDPFSWPINFSLILPP